MTHKEVTSCRSAIDLLAEENELVSIDAEVDPLLEVSGIAKALDNGVALLFRNIKGYPGKRLLNGLFSRGTRVAKMFGVPDHRKLKFKALEAMRAPLPPRRVTSGVCQENVITKDIDVLGALPMLKYTATDPGRILSGGNILISGPEIGNCISYKRMHFRGKDWSAMAFNPGSHFEYWVLKCRKDRKNLPLTININPSPAVQAVASSGGMLAAMPVGTDELAIAGGLQGSPVEICPAKTVDAWSVANAEWVIEGYMDTSQVVWESEEAEKKKDFAAPFFPEGYGYLGRAHATYKFQTTAITHRSDNPIFYAPVAHSFEYVYQTFLNDALVYDLLSRQAPDVVVDVNALPSMMGQLGIIIQVRKQRRRDEAAIRNLLAMAWAVCPSFRAAVIVDDDIDIYDANEVMWAVLTRADPKEDFILMPPAQSWAGQQGEDIGPSAATWRIGVDASVPVEHKWQYSRGEFPAVDLERWLTKSQVLDIKALQCEYAKLLAQKRV